MNNAEATREVMGNIAPWMRVVFYLLITASMALAGWQLNARARLWWLGQPGERERDWRVGLRRIAVYALGQRRVRRRSLGGVLHLLIFSGFVVLTIGTTLLAIAHLGPVNFHRGTYYLLYEATMDLFGVLFLAGCLLALYRRAFARPPELGHTPADYALLGLLLAIGVTGFLIEGLRLVWMRTPPAVAEWSPVGTVLAHGFAPALGVAGARSAHVIVWWVHIALIVSLFSLFVRSRLRHAATGTLNIALRPSRAAGALAAVSMEEVEKTGRIGVASLEEFTRQQRLSWDACMECGRCEAACPAFATGKPLSPKALVQDLRRAMDSPPRGTNGTLIGDVILPETLWSCTMCQACVFECPVLIGHVDLVADMRRNLVGAGSLSGPPAQALRRVGSQGNPYGHPQGERLAWAKGLDVPTVAENPDYEVLLWVGCAASFDPRAQRVARATAKLLRSAGVNFAALGREERCTGDPARRLGDEFLFQQHAEQNVTALQAAQPRRIVTPCPHCFNTLRNEYPTFGGQFEVLHHSQFLSHLMGDKGVQVFRSSDVQVSDSDLSDGSDRSDRSPNPQSTIHNPQSVTLHDPCYLARVNGETASTRALVAASGAELREMPRHGAKTFCCGAGGGRFWFEEAPEQRVNRKRAAEAAATGAERVVTACPFCLNMMSDGVAGTPEASNMQVIDVAELLLESLPQPPAPEAVPPGGPP